MGPLPSHFWKEHRFYIQVGESFLGGKLIVFHLLAQAAGFRKELLLEQAGQGAHAGCVAGCLDPAGKGPGQETNRQGILDSQIITIAAGNINLLDLFCRLASFF